RATAAKRIFPAIVGATMTTIVVLIPFLYLQGNARAAFFPFAAAFAMALVWSVFAAVVLSAAMIAYLGWYFYKKVPRYSWSGFSDQRSFIVVNVRFPRGSNVDNL